MTNPVRVVVCGTAFGQVYLEALAAGVEPFELAGVLATGSARSRACAARHGVPLWTTVDSVPADVRVACVVVGGGLLGGPGSDLARQLMARGIHVLQEHPLHRDELAGLVREARRHHVVHRMNAFYAHLPAVRRFLEGVRVLAERYPVRYVDGACGFPVGFAMLDLMARAAGALRPWRVEVCPDPAASVRSGVGFRSIEGSLGGVGLSLRLQNRLDPAAPDAYLHLLHRLTVGTDAGELTLVSTNGPVVWAPRPRIPAAVHEVRDEIGYVAAAAGGGPAFSVLGPTEGVTETDVYGVQWPAGVGDALRSFLAAVDGEGPDRLAQYHLGLCELWQEIAGRLGPPAPAGPLVTRPLDADGHAALVAAVAGPDLVVAGGHRG